MRKPITISLRRFRARMTHSPWGTHLLVAWVVLSLMFAFTPCCEVIGAASAAPASASTDHGHRPDAHDSTHAPDSGDPCATWLDRSDAMPPKTDDASSPGAKIALATPFVFLPSASPVATAWRPFRLSASPPYALYLRHARLIL